MNKRYVLIIILTVSCIISHAQKKTFMRLYSLSGHKFNKGYFVSTTDSSIFIYRNKITVEISASNIGFIKTNRSVGHDFLIGELVVTGLFTLAGAIVGSADKGRNNNIPETARGAGFGFALGCVLGLPTGAIIAGNKKRATFTIHGNIDTWRLQRKNIELLSANK